MMQYGDFTVGDTVIDTVRGTAPQLCALIPDSVPQLCVLEDGESDGYYITRVDNIIQYDKYWFDQNGQKQN